MGNEQSGKNKSEEDSKDKPKNEIPESQRSKLVSMIDNIATKFILESDFQNLIDLQDKNKCHKLTIMTSKILKKYFSPMEILYLKQRTEKGSTVNILDRKDFAFINTEQLENLDIKNDFKKKTICLGIAKFYTSFFHLFASIAKVINPMYKYRDSSGNIIYVDLLNKNSIPKGTDKNRFIMSLCYQRYKQLLPTEDEEGNLKVKDLFCHSSSKSILQEPGIKELEKLYYDSFNYDPDNKVSGGTFYKMSDEMKVIYKKDVDDFYKAFTGLTTVPDTIQSFSDINTFDFNTLDTCNSGEIHKYTGPKTDPTFVNYGNHLKKMLQNTKVNQELLVEILDEMFQYTVFHAETKNPVKKLIIHPELTIPSLKELTNRARGIIIKIFLDCEKDYKNGIKLFVAIIKNQKFKREVFKIKKLKELQQKIMEQREEDDPTKKLIDSNIVKPVKKEEEEKKEEKEQKEINIEQKNQKIAEELGTDVKSTSAPPVAPVAPSDTQTKFLGKPPDPGKIQLNIRKAPPSGQNTNVKIA